MHNTIKNNEQDAFSKSIRQKIEGHKVPVEPAVWEAIEAGLNAPKAKNKFGLVWWISTGVAAALALLLYLNIPVAKHRQTTLSSNITNTGNVVKTSKSIVEIALNNDAKVEMENNNPKVKSVTTELKINEPTVSVTNLTQAEVIGNKVVPDENAITYVQLNDDTTEIAEVEPDLISNSTNDTMPDKPLKNAPDRLQLKNEDWTDPLEAKSNKNWTLVAMVGSAGKASANTQAVPVLEYRPRMGIVAAPTTSATIFAPEDFSDKTFVAPLTAGFAIARNLSPKLSIESGVSYTYLLTIFKNNQIDAKLNLHYLGIPIRMVYDFSKNKKWTFYTSAGGMIEKGLWSVYVQHQSFSNNLITTTVTDKIDGFQFSINGSLGGAYSVYKNASVYFEPKISYYFDTNQPISIRTENSLVLGFEGGLRYKF